MPSLKQILPIATAALFTAPFFSMDAALAQEVPQLQMGMPYAQARQLILNAGWQPSYNAPDTKAWDFLPELITYKAWAIPRS